MPVDSIEHEFVHISIACTYMSITHLADFSRRTWTGQPACPAYAQERRQASTGMLLILVCRLIPAFGKPNETCPCRGILLIPPAPDPRENLIPLSYLLTLSLGLRSGSGLVSPLRPTLDAAATSSPLGLFQLGSTTSPPSSISLLRLLLDCGTTLDPLVLPGCPNLRIHASIHASANQPVRLERRRKPISRPLSRRLHLATCARSTEKDALQPIAKCQVVLTKGPRVVVVWPRPRSLPTDQALDIIKPSHHPSLCRSVRPAKPRP